MKQLHFILLIFLFCFCVLSFAQVISDFKVNDDVESSSQCYPRISIDDGGNFVITWTTEDVIAQRYSSDGTALGSNFKVNDGEGFPQYPSISSDADGNFVIIWKEFRNGHEDIYAQRYSNDGTALGNNFKVNDSEGSSGGWYSGNPPPTISLDFSGNFVITWTDDRNGDFDIYAQRYSNDGTALGSNFKVNDDEGNGYQEYSSISSDSSGNSVIVWGWSIDRDIYTQRYSSEGIAIGDNFKVNSDTIAFFPSISSDRNGNFVITWGGNGYNIYAQRYSTDGTALGSNFKVNDGEILGIGGLPKISLDSSGNFVITWVDFRNGDGDIYAQRYSNDGSVIGQNFLVTNSSDSNQYSPDVKLWNGHIYNTWKDKRNGENDIWANVLDWDNPVGINDRDLLQTLSAYKLSQNFPNPFNPSTTIEFNLPKTADVRIEVYNTTGQKIQTLLNQKMSAGSHQVEWDASGFSSGVYFYRIEAGEFQDVKKMILLR